MVDKNCDETEKSRVKQKTWIKIKDGGRELHQCTQTLSFNMPKRRMAAINAAESLIKYYIHLTASTK